MTVARINRIWVGYWLGGPEPGRTSQTYGSLSRQTFNFKGSTYTVINLYYNTREKELSFSTIPLFPRGFELYLDSQQFNSAACRNFGFDRIWNSATNRWYIGDLNWSPGQIVQVRVVETTPVPPGPPTNLQATTHFADVFEDDVNVTLTWDPHVNTDPTSLRVEKYHLRISDDGGTTWDRDWNYIDYNDSGEKIRSSTTIGSGRVDVHYRFSNGTEYTFEVRAKGGDGFGDAARVTLIVNKITSMYARTPQVSDAIVEAVLGVNEANDVTEAHLAAITSLDLSSKGITSLQAGDFDGLTSLTNLSLGENSISDISALEELNSLTNLSLFRNSISDISALDGLTSLTNLSLGENSISDISALEELTSLTNLYLSSNSISDISALEELTSLTNLSLGGNSISDISALENLTALTRLNLDLNSISDISALEELTSLTNLSLGENSISDISALEELTSLTNLYLSSNSISDISALEELTSLTNLSLGGNSISDISALENLTALTRLNLDLNSISDISALEELTSLTNLYLSSNSISDISALENLTALTELWLYRNSISDISALEELTSLISLRLRGNPISDYGPLRRLKAANAGVRIDIDIDNNIPTFSDGDSATRSIAENTASGQNIGSAVAATDADNDTLTYSLGGTEAASFSIVSTTGQLQTKASLDYETKTSYSVIVSVSDGNGGSSSITVTINVTDVAESIIDPPLSQRTPQVRDAIVTAIPGVSNANDVTEAHLTAIRTLNLSGKSITSLKSGDFSGLSTLSTLYLNDNQLTNLPEDIFSGLTSLNNLYFNQNNLKQPPCRAI